MERENTDFLAALEDAMEQYKQQVNADLIRCLIIACHIPLYLMWVVAAVHKYLDIDTIFIILALYATTMDLK